MGPSDLSDVEQNTAMHPEFFVFVHPMHIKSARMRSKEMVAKCGQVWRIVTDLACKGN